MTIACSLSILGIIFSCIALVLLYNWILVRELKRMDKKGGGKNER